MRSTKINETKSWPFDNMNKIDKPLAGWTKRRLELPKSEMKMEPLQMLQK